MASVCNHVGDVSLRFDMTHIVQHESRRPKALRAPTSHLVPFQTQHTAPTPQPTQPIVVALASNRRKLSL